MELSSIDQRISELKSRLNRKRTLNEQLNAQMKSHLLKGEQSANNQSNAFNDNLNNENDVPNCNSILKANLRRSIGAGQASSRFGVACRPFNAVEPLKRQPRSEFDLTSATAAGQTNSPVSSSSLACGAEQARQPHSSTAYSSQQQHHSTNPTRMVGVKSTAKRSAKPPAGQPNVDKSNQLNASSPSLARTTATGQASINYAGQQADKSGALNGESDGTNLITAISSDTAAGGAVFGSNPHFAVGQRLPDQPPGHPATNQFEPSNFQFSPFDQKEFNFSQNLPNQRLNAINNTAKYKIVDRGQKELHQKEPASDSSGDHSEQSNLSEPTNHQHSNNSFVSGQNENLGHNSSSDLSNHLSNHSKPSNNLSQNLSGNLSNNLSHLSNKLSVNPNIHQNPHQSTHNQNNGLNILSSESSHIKPVNVSPALSSASSSALSDFVPSASSSVTDLNYQSKSTVCRYAFNVLDQFDNCRIWL